MNNDWPFTATVTERSQEEIWKGKVKGLPVKGLKGFRPVTTKEKETWGSFYPFLGDKFLQTTVQATNAELRLS